MSEKTPVVKPHSHEGVYFVILGGKRRLATRNISPGFKVYGEDLIEYKGEEYRLWDPNRSKLAAAILKNLERVPIKPSGKVLYLGAATGTTPSHVADIVGRQGVVFCVEFAPRAMRELVIVCERKSNMVPVMADARYPERYSTIVDEVETIYCDVAQPEQAKLLADNADMFLRKGGWILLAIKARSIDVTKKPSEVYKREIAVLEDRGFRVRQTISLEPFDRAHSMVLAKYS
ncbi:MAG: fibrillarin-like rRNA/tRNA 2'-O-methyltransferase [Candidatus Freyarchaeota archaeon]|nr:fibrillarin-like rRNA/tRNA 2'-O-methyltransferase [Candidatus Jordarchaeia archaeon]